MKHKLAIVIPAYKERYLAETLESIRLQTCKDFNLYIGDDCSSENIKGVVDTYSSKMDIIYQLLAAILS